jgi:hypothetical protein
VLVVARPTVSFGDDDEELDDEELELDDEELDDEELDDEELDDEELDGGVDDAPGWAASGSPADAASPVADADGVAVSVAASA